MDMTTFESNLRLHPTHGMIALAMAAGLLTTPVVHAQNTVPAVATPATAASDSAPASSPSTTTSATPAAAAEVPSRSGTFKTAEGEVAVIRAQARSTPAPGAALAVGDRIATGANGSAIVTLRDGTVLTVGPNSVVALSRFNFEPTTQRGSFLAELFEGSIRVVTGLLARVNPGLFKVNTPTSVVGVRGTDFIVEAESNPAVRKALP